MSYFNDYDILNDDSDLSCIQDFEFDSIESSTTLSSTDSYIQLIELTQNYYYDSGRVIGSPYDENNTTIVNYIE